MPQERRFGGGEGGDSGRFWAHSPCRGARFVGGTSSLPGSTPSADESFRSSKSAIHRTWDSIFARVSRLTSQDRMFSLATRSACVRPASWRSCLTAGPAMFRGGFKFRIRNLTMAETASTLVPNSEHYSRICFFVVLAQPRSAPSAAAGTTALTSSKCDPAISP